MEITEEEFELLKVLYVDLSERRKSLFLLHKVELKKERADMIQENIKRLDLITRLIEDYDTRNLYPKRITRRSKKRIAQKA